MLLVLLQIINVAVTAVISIPTVYDQRQTGKSNIRIDVKDAILIAVADDFGDYDYTYDYSDLTIKPEVPSSTSLPTTTKPMPSNHSSSTTAATATSDAPHGIHTSSLVLDADNSTLTFVSTEKPGNESIAESEFADDSGNRTRPLAGHEYQIPVMVVHDGTKENTKLLPVKMLEKQSTANEDDPRRSGDAPPQSRHCSQGFFLDNHNRCKRIRKPLRERHQP